MTQLRFDDSGRIRFHQDFWDSSEGVYRRIPDPRLGDRRRRRAHRGRGVNMCKTLLGIVLLALPFCAQAQLYSFEVYLDDKRIGSHRFYPATRR